jgi:hypothetical protein
MPIPNSIADLSATAASNSPSGSDSPTEGDNYLRALSAIIKQVYESTFTNAHEIETVAAGDTVVTFTSLTYTVGTNSVWGICDGVVFTAAGGDFTENSSTQLTLAAASTRSRTFVFFAGRPLATGVPISSLSSKGIAEDEAGGPADEASFHFRRRANYSGGTPGLVNSAIRGDTFVESSPGLPSTATSFEWAGCFVVHNRSPFGENVGAYRQGIKYPGAGPTWGGTDEIIDWQTDPTSGAVGCELSFTANGTDANRTRVGYDMALRKRDSGGASPTLSWGFRIQTETGSKVNRAYGFAPSATVDIAFDATEATVGQAALAMAENQPIAFNAALSRKLFHDGTGLKFTDASNNLLFRLNDTGIPQFGIASTAAATPGSFAANRTIRIQQLDGTVLYIPAMLSTW